MSKKQIDVKEDSEVNIYESMNFNEGFENVTSADLSLPFIKLVQRTSNKITEQNPDAKYGDIYNNVLGSLYDGREGILCSLCYFAVNYVEMIPMDAGGGVVEFHKSLANLDIRNENGKWITKDGNHIIQSNYHYVKMWEPEQFEGVIILSSTQIKKSKMWITISRSLRAPGHPEQALPLYYGLYRLTSVDETKNNFKYKGWNIKFEAHPSKEQLIEARNAYLVIKEAKQRADNRMFQDKQLAEEIIAES